MEVLAPVDDMKKANAQDAASAVNNSPDNSSDIHTVALSMLILKGDTRECSNESAIPNPPTTTPIFWNPRRVLPIAPKAKRKLNRPYATSGDPKLQAENIDPANGSICPPLPSAESNEDSSIGDSTNENPHDSNTPSSQQRSAYLLSEESTLDESGLAKSNRARQRQMHVFCQVPACNEAATHVSRGLCAIHFKEKLDEGPADGAERRKWASKMHKKGSDVIICTFPRCTKGARSKGLCKRHGGGKRCGIPECTRSDQGGGFCIKHGGGRRCSVDGCKNSSQAKGLCKRHGGIRIERSKKLVG
ncbi:hypothetical protein LEN26_000773 [Aphanomyces euteiches]|nr:hypothetical protein LEN26_000773 [Aphanomyces euteiches]KAH9192445.1 hypothetical protein AeNC1_005578 [Aphanomyces euteiches]